MLVTSMIATTGIGLSIVIGLPIAFVVVSAAAFTGLFVLWSRARS